jgi:hypothetical protein
VFGRPRSVRLKPMSLVNMLRTELAVVFWRGETRRKPSNPIHIQHLHSQQTGRLAKALLVPKDHRSTFLLYYAELNTGSSCPKPKVYLSIRHSATTMTKYPRGLPWFLEKRERQGLAEGSDCSACLSGVPCSPSGVPSCEGRQQRRPEMVWGSTPPSL